MEVAIGNNTPPFQREVREWQHIDPNTGALLTGRLEADRWVNGPLNTYGKMVSHNLSTPDGTQHTQRKQLEILQARTSSGAALQVVRAQTVQTSSSRWSSSNTSSSNSTSYATSMSNNHLTSSNSFLTNHNNSKTLTASPPTASSQASSVSLKNLTQQNVTSSSPLSLSQLQSNYHANKQQQKSVDLQHQQQTHESPTKFLRSTMILPTENSTNKFNHLNNDNNNVGGFTKHMDFNKLYNSFNERETTNNASDSFASRGRSVSIEDLTNFDESNFDDDVEPTEWKRVSKLRRSLQFPKSSAPRTYSRPPDLPENSVSVLKIKQELENGRRLNTAMRNNHVDFVALDSILKTISTDSVPKPEPRTTKKASFITAESLKEIRGRLRKLSNESLYKEDMSPIDESINEEKPAFENGDEKWSTNKIFVSRNANESPQLQQPQHNSNSLESRNRSKEKDVNSDDWHTRRKSYGFEKMFQPSETFGKMESSTDSGIGRSSDLNSNWSPTIDNSQRGTVITFGDKKQQQSSPPTTATTSITLLNGSHEIKQNSSSPLRRTPDVSVPSAVTRRSEADELKRHSIAVDESRYVNENLRRAVDRKTSLVHLNGHYDDHFSSQEGILDDGKRHKRVEFCKTEIHFAAESGRVNIVETDGKPPPTNNFRRRRRTSGSNICSSYLEAINSGVPVTHFGDTEKKTFDNEFDVKPDAPASNVHVTTSIGSAHGDLNNDNDTDGQSDDNSLRGILKNKPVKPKPYHLGENLDNSESLWGVRLKHVNNEHSMWRNSAELDSKIDLILSEPDINAAEPTVSNHLTKPLDEFKENNAPSPSFGYSTKINLSSNSPSFSWQNKDFSHLPASTTSAFSKFNNDAKIQETNDDMKTTKISIDLKSDTITTAQPLTTKSINLLDDLKSTSLIIRTMRSANNFDEALRDLESYSHKDKLNIHEPRMSAFKLVRNNSLSKSNSASNVFKDHAKMSMPKYSASLDGDCGILDAPTTEADRLKDFEVLNEILEENKRISLKLMSSSINKRNISSDKTRLSNFKDFVAQNSATSYKTSKYEPQIQSQIYEQPTREEKPVAAPRIKKLLSSTVLSQQLSQLKRLYDAANEDEDSDDSAKADEEVKLYLGNLSSSEEKSTELSGSWSRVKAKRNTYKQQYMSYKNEHNLLDDPKWTKKALNTTEENGKLESVHSNLMSITLESPNASLKKTPNTSSSTQPVATPRLVNLPVIARSAGPSPNLSRNNSFRKKEETTPLKISTGTRQLREHELSYFGVNKPSTPTPTSQKTNVSTVSASHSTSTKIVSNTSINYVNDIHKTVSTPPVSNSQQPLTSTPSASTFAATFLTPSPTKLTTNSNSTSTKINHSSNMTSNKWQLSNEKPDLIKYSQNIDQDRETKLITSTASKSHSYNMDSETKTHSQKITSLITPRSSIDETQSEPIYQNIQKISSPTKYNRKLDLERDEKILNELTRAADEIMHTCQEMINADNEEKKRRSSLKTSVLDTITEGRQQNPPQPQVHQAQPKVMKSKGIQVSRNFEDSLRRYNKIPQRTSSQSSIDSIPQANPSSKSSSTASSLNKKSMTNGHESAASSKSSVRRRASGSEVKRVQRVCSRERMHRESNASSSEDLPNSSAEAPRRPRRTKIIKDKSESNAKHDAKTSSTKSSSRSVSERSSSRRVHRSEGSTRSTKTSSSEKRSSKTTVMSPTSSSVPPTSSTTPTTTPSKKCHR